MYVILCFEHPISFYREEERKKKQLLTSQVEVADNEMVILAGCFKNQIYYCRCDPLMYPSMLAKNEAKSE